MGWIIDDPRTGASGGRALPIYAESDYSFTVIIARYRVLSKRE
jgi:hypothetical protein